MGQDSQTGAWGTLSSLKDEPAQQPSSLPSFRVGQVLSDTFATFSGNFIRFWAVSLLIFVPIIFGSGLVWALIAISGVDPASAADEVTGVWVAFIFMIGGTFLATFIMMSAICYGAVEFQAGRKAQFMDMLKAAVRALVPVVIAAVLTGILYFIGLILLIVPGLIVLLMLSVATPAIVFERLGPLKGLRRSRELTSGYKWQILGCFILMVLVTTVVNILVMIPLSFITVAIPGEAAAQIVSGIVSLILSGAYYGFMGSGVAAIYTNLRAAKEGASADDIAAVFE